MSKRDPVLDEYGHAWFGTGDYAVPSTHLFEDGPRMTPDGDPIEEYWMEFEPGYWVSNYGDVYSSKTKKMMAVSKNVGNKYPAFRVCLGDAKHSKLKTLHRVLAESFVPNPDNCSIVRHLDDNPDNYDLENLEWGTHKDNWHDAINNGVAHPLSEEDSKKGSAKSRRPIVAISKQTGERLQFESLHEAERQIGVQAPYICNCLKDKLNNPYYDFEYL